MRKVIRLVGVQLWAVLADMLSIGKSRSKKPKVLYVSILLFILLMSAISFFYSFMIGSGLKSFRSLELLPALMMAVVCIMILMTTVFKVKGTIFGFRDYDMLMSLPVSTGAIVACRLIILYMLNFMFVIIMIVPMMAAYGILAGPGIMFYILCFVSMFFIPLVPIVAASFLGTIIAYAASKFKYSNLLNIIFSLGLVFVVIGLSFTIQDNGQEFVDMGRAVTDQVNAFYPLAQMFTETVIDYDVTAFLLFIVISIAAFLLYTALVKAGFKKINTLIMTGRYHANFKMGEIKTASPLKALYRKELKRYFSSALYVLNTGIGVVLLTLGAIAIIFVDLDKILGDPQAVPLLADNSPIFISFCIIMTCSSMASISLEGRSLWIIKSLPVTPKTVYLSKIAVNLTILSPAIIDAIIIGTVLKLGILKTLLLVSVTAACSVLIAFYGLLINLIFPNFTWTTEVVVIKQSAASMITVFSGMAYVGIQFLLIFLLQSFFPAYLAYLLLTVILDIALYITVMTYGKKRYLALQ